MKVVFGTSNRGKLEDVNSILATSGADFEVAAFPDLGVQMPEVEETGKTFEENALIKYDALRPLVPEENVLVTEDSGLEIDALGGKPGVYSRRWEPGGRELTDQEVLDKVLAEMADKKDRTARFVSVIAFGGAGIPRQTVRGELVGELLERPDMKGFEEGFPYRALFYLPQLKKMLYEVHDIPPEERDGLLTHREKAWAELARAVNNT